MTEEQNNEAARMVDLSGMVGPVEAEAVRELVAACTCDAAPPLTASELAQNTSRISWMAAQGDLHIETVYLMPGARRQVEIIDDGDNVIGVGATLMAALDDAMGVQHG